jgi:hypothetical protein
MPKVTIWIRVEDYDYWKQIGDKPSFLHDAIRVQRNSFGGSLYNKKVKSVKRNGKDVPFERINDDGTIIIESNGHKITEFEIEYTDPEQTA